MNPRFSLVVKPPLVEGGGAGETEGDMHAVEELHIQLMARHIAC
jgi:hypothetical protein